jgi:competence protein ComEC
MSTRISRRCGNRVIVLLVATVATVALAALPVRAGPVDKRLDIYWVDVEGGAATLVVTPAGESFLIDSGYPGARDAARIHKVATEAAGLRQIDHLVTTHYHLDHFGGAPTLATLMPVRNVYDNGQFKEGWEKPSKEYLEFKAEKRLVLNPGEEIALKAAEGSKPPRVRCLAARQQIIPAPAGALPNEDCRDAKRQRPDYSDNANSVVLLLTFGDFEFFDAGDLTWNLELQLVCPVKLVPEVDAFQVTHHGTDTSNPPLLIKGLSPTVAVVNNGPRKGGQPKTFATLKATPSVQAIYQLHRNVQAGEEHANTEDALIANAAEPCQANHIKLSVAPDGRSYTVSIPATGHTRTFATKPQADALKTAGG